MKKPRFTPLGATCQGVICLLLASGTALGQDYLNPDVWGLCVRDPLAELIPRDRGIDESTAPIDFSANYAETTQVNSLLEGSVVVQRGDQRLNAAQVRLDREANRVTAEGGVTFGEPRLAVRSDTASLDLDAETGAFEGAEYYIPERNAQGSAARVAIDRVSKQSRLETVTYSTCARGDEAWQLRAGNLYLDEEAGRGSARHITLALGGVPVMYLPYLSFPINDDRQSGFLAPTFGNDSESGLDIRVPYYWNIAPSMDATLSPRILSERGLLLGGEFRYLQPGHSGEFRGEYLPSDAKFGDDRASVNVTHRSNMLPGLYTDLLYQWVSDKEYLTDLDNNLNLLDPSYLEQRLDALYFGGNWLVLGRLQDFQTIDSTIFANDNEPYGRLPQLLFQGTWANQAFGLSYGFQGEMVRFTHDERVEGGRVDIEPTISLPLVWPAGFVTPSASYRFTAYELNNDDNTIDDTNPIRHAPIFSLDSGLFFERPIDWEWFGSGLQTLEPRLFYLYVPRRDQDDIPLFDTTEVDRSYAWLFLDNRFTGADRLGDANQLTTALTTRLIDTDSGDERLRASIGQIHYFSQRDVTLLNTDPDETNSSDIIAEAFFQVTDGFSLRGTVQWDPDQNDTRRNALDIRYRPAPGRLANIAYRFADDQELEQVDASFLWTINPRWRTLGRWNYSLAQGRNMDILGGFEYGDCCWAVRMLARRHREDAEQDLDNSIYVEVELKGLAGLGSDIDQVLEDAVLGYGSLRY